MAVPVPPIDGSHYAPRDIVGILTSTADINVRTLPLNERTYFGRKARATKALGFRMGNVGNFSLDVPVVMWEEIWNQLLFLLSL